jgi:hypothetical protein
MVRLIISATSFREGGVISLAVRQPGYLLQASSRRPIGFAPPLHSGFAFLAAPERLRVSTVR